MGKKRREIQKTVIKKKSPKNNQSDLAHKILISGLMVLIILGTMATVTRIRLHFQEKEGEALIGELKEVSPSAGILRLLPNEQKIFSITPQGYQQIKWYLDGKEVNIGSGTYQFQAESGNHIIRVEMQNGTRTETVTWSIVIAEDTDENAAENPLPATDGTLIFFFIIAAIMIIIFIVLWLFIKEKNVGEDPSLRPSKLGKKKNSKEDNINFFNIPR